MRRKAEKAGNLKSSEQVKVVSSPTTVEIQPANPQVIYVPTYNPQVVYAPAPPPPPGPSTGAVVATGLIAFGLGVAVGAAASNNCCWYGGSMSWHSHTVVVANTAYSRTWATRAYIPPPPPYYRAGGPYPAGRPPLPPPGRAVAYGNTAYRGNTNVNVNNVNNVNVNVNRNNANVNNVNRNVNANTNTVNRGNVSGGAAANTNNRGGAAARQPEAASRGYSRPAESGRASTFSGAGNGRSERAAADRGERSRRSRQR